jgi:hypothetical protein
MQKAVRLLHGLINQSDTIVAEYLRMCFGYIGGLSAGKKDAGVADVRSIKTLRGSSSHFGTFISLEHSRLD